MESFFGTLKTECLRHYKFKTRDEAKRVMFEYIEVLYNRIRRHAKINKLALLLNLVVTQYCLSKLFAILFIQSRYLVK